jgi:M6 family metalloprotease-like protein
MKKIFIVTLTSALLFQSAAFAVVAEGSTKSCKVGTTKKDSRHKYNCVKPGVWKKINNTVKKTQTPAPKITSTPNPILSEIIYSIPSQPSSNVDVCKIKEVSKSRGFTAAGFPSILPLTKKYGTVKWALIPVDFKDLPGEKNFRSRIDSQTKMLSEWFYTVSEGKFKVEWVIADNWTTVPGVSSDYSLDKKRYVNNTDGGIKLFREAMTAADNHFNFTNIQTVNFILPLSQNIANEGENGFPWDQHVKSFITNEGSISSFTIAGKQQTMNNKSLWNYWAHEFGHAIGLPHVGSNGPERSPFNDWDILGDQDGPTRELSGWTRFVGEWLNDERVYCQELNKLNSTEITLVPLSDNKPGIKMVVLPIDQSKTLVIESRRATKFSVQSALLGNGVLAYVYDSRIGHGKEFLVPVLKENNPLLYEGSKIKFEGVLIEVLNSKNLDKIKISK